MNKPIRVMVFLLALAGVLMFEGCGENQPPQADQPQVIAPVEPKLQLEWQFEGLAPDTQNPMLMVAKGSLRTSKAVTLDSLGNLLKVIIADKELPVAWQPAQEANQFEFVVAGIERQAEPREVVLSWDGKMLEADGDNARGQHELIVPALRTLAVTGYDRNNADPEGKSCVFVSFSDLLDSQQDLNGLVQFAGQDAQTQVAGNRLLACYAGMLQPGEYQLVVHAGIKAAAADIGKLPEQAGQQIAIELAKPGVRFVGKGSILPESQTMEIPFEARGVHSVQVTAMEIYPENIEQFLQVNGLNGDREVERVGRYVWRKTIALNSVNSFTWNRYSLNASDLFKTKPGTLYRLELSIGRAHSAYPCAGGNAAPAANDNPPVNFEDDDGTQASGWDGISDYYQEADGGYDWEQRDNPCDDSYYRAASFTRDSHNYYASNLGLIAKQDGNGKLHVIATDLRTASPANGVKIWVRNYQGQTLAEASTDGDGFAELSLSGTPFLLLAQKDKDLAYLKLNANTALETSQFDVGGEVLSKGVKGALYGERGVWRPGDDIHLTFVLQDRSKALPENHPVRVQLFDPQGKLVQTLINKEPFGPFYQFRLKTADNAPTGDWLVKATLGGSTFDKKLKIETVRPNRLKVELDYGVEALHGYAELPEAKLFAQWLHGGTASALHADVSVRLRSKKTQFGRFADFVFDDPARSLETKDQQLVDGVLDESGTLRFNQGFQPEQPAPGMLSAAFTSRVHEEGGGFSISRQDIDYHQFAHYVGIRLPKGDQERDMLLTDMDHVVEIATLNADGGEVSLPQVEVTLYKVEWKWWWDKVPESLAEYADASHGSKLAQSVISTTDGKGEWRFQVKYPDWGRYLIRACDLEGQHCTGKTVYIDWPGWAGRAQEEGSGGAAVLRFASDKTSYQVGEVANIQLPESEVGRALLTVETSSRILTQQWLDLDGKRGQFSLPITADMSPNAYVNVSLLQPHEGKRNDRPIRLYGIIPLLVEDPATRLVPIIKAAEEWQPERAQTFSISEQSGRAMDYTLAVVDEGLLGLTRFTAPDLHKVFYKKEALGITSWDLFDAVIGGYVGDLERILAIGGGDEAPIDDAANKPKRFPPVVEFLGTFHLDAGQVREHSIDLPPYLGALRIMAVAAEGVAYGKAEQSVYVRQPLMILPSLPRTLKIGEQIQVPVNLFVSDQAIKSVELSMQADAAFADGSQKQSVPITKLGETVINLALKAGAVPAQGKLRFKATSGQHVSQYEVNLEVLAPNLPSQRNLAQTLDSGGDWSQMVTPFGLPGTNQATLELSSIPNLNLESHLDYLVHYPHGCLEQTTSAAFPQLYLPKLLQLEPGRQEKIEHHIKKAISKIEGFQASGGNLMYWPGTSEANDWASLYAGHFLVETEKAGYKVPLQLMSGWLGFQSRQAQQWSGVSVDASSATQAYRLYVLALAGKPQLGAMNRLRESGNASIQARWILAAAYALAGQPEAARQTTASLNPLDVHVAPSQDSFSGKLGQLGLQLEVLLALGRQQDAEGIIQQISSELGKGAGHNTHDISWALLSVAHYLAASKEPLLASYAIDQGKAQTLKSAQPVLAELLGKMDKAFKLDVRNQGDRPLYANLSQRGIADVGEEQAESSGLAIRASLSDSEGKEAWESGSKLEAPLQLGQGKDYQLEMIITNQSGHAIKHLALSALLPSGVEIGSTDLDDDKSATDAEDTTQQQKPTVPAISYQDIRDDRVLSYFDLGAGEHISIKIRLNAAFMGSYYFPAISAEAMYQPLIRARTAGIRVQVIKAAVPVKEKAPAEVKAQA